MAKSNTLIPPWQQPRETTRVSDETERKIPLRVWLSSCLLGLFIALCLTGAGYLAHLQVCKWAGRAGGWPDRAWAFTRMNWPILSIPVLLLWAFFTFVLLWRFQIENATKHGPPVMDMWPAWLGMWTPWVWRRFADRPDRPGILDRYREIFGGGDGED